MRLLIIEDSDSVARMIEALLSTRGYEVRSAGSGTRGLEDAFAWQPNIIVLDMNVAGAYTGLDVCEKLHSSPETRDIPVIVISERNDDEAKQRAHDAGAVAFYEKPFSPLALLKEIESLHRRSGQWTTSTS